MYSEPQDSSSAPDMGSRDEAQSDSSGIKRRGFGSLSAERRKEIASQGGKAAHRLGRAHVFTREEAQAAGRKGGSIIGQDSEHMARIGSTGGNSRWTKARAATAQEDDNRRAS